MVTLVISGLPFQPIEIVPNLTSTTFRASDDAQYWRKDLALNNALRRR
jgi:hypothetical protein